MFLYQFKGSSTPVFFDMYSIHNAECEEKKCLKVPQNYYEMEKSAPRGWWALQTICAKKKKKTVEKWRSNKSNNFRHSNVENYFFG